MDIHKLRMKLFKNSVLYTWTLFFLLLLIVSISASWFIYQKAISALGNETEQSYQQELNRVKYLFDKELNEMKRIALEQSLNTDLQQLIQMESVSAQSRVTMLLLQRRLEVYCISNTSIEDIVIGFNDTDIAISNRSIYTIRQVSEMLLDGNLLSELEKRVYRSKFMIINKKQLQYLDTFQPTIIYLQSLPLMSASKNNAFIMIKLRSESVMKLLPPEVGRVLSLYDGNNALMLSNSEITNGSSKQINLDDFRLYASKSDISSLTYRYYISNKIFFDKINHINTFTKFSLISCIVLFISSLAVFLRLNYNPIHRIFLKINEQVNEKATRTKNELSFIEGSLHHMLCERQSMIGTLDKQTSALREYFLLRLLKGEVKDEPTNTEFFPKHGLYFDCNCYIVIIVKPKNLFDCKKESEDRTDRLKLALFMIKNVFDEIAKDILRVNSLEMDDSVAIILGQKQSSEGNKEIEPLGVLEMASYSLRNIFNLDVLMTSSKKVTSLGEIRIAYNQAQEMVEYCQLFEKNIAIYTRNPVDVNRIETKSMLMNNKKLSNCISIGDFIAAKSMIDEIFNDYFAEDSTVSTTRINMNGMIHVVYSSLTDFSSTFYKQLDIDNIIYPLLECKSLNVFKSKIIAAFDEIAEKYRQQQEGNNIQRFDDIQRYIESSFMDKDLSVGKIADAFDMSMPYLSKAFKKNTSIGLLDYIHKIRVNEAKKLFETKKYNINEIACMVGFIDSSSFIKVFKKIEGIPPGKYTKINA